jgi:hypothetical protein
LLMTSSLTLLKVQEEPTSMGLISLFHLAEVGLLLPPFFFPL